jgi:hypothetical protein
MCESLLLPLTELKVITDGGARDLLTDVVNSHGKAADAREAQGRDEGCRSAASTAKTACARTNAD